MKILESDKLITKINNAISIGEKYFGYSKESFSELSAILTDIEELSFEWDIDKMGKWEYSFINEEGERFYICSECRNPAHYNFLYCPYCGAKMREKENFDF